MSEAKVATVAQLLLLEKARQIAYLEAQLEAARALTQSLEEEAHACPNQAHHRGWWTSHEDDL